MNVSLFLAGQVQQRIEELRFAHSRGTNVKVRTPDGDVCWVSDIQYETLPNGGKAIIISTERG